MEAPLQRVFLTKWDYNIYEFTMMICDKFGLTRDPIDGNMYMEDENGDKTLLKYNDKVLRFPIDCANSPFSDWVEFDPLFDRNVLKFLFDIYVDSTDDDVTMRQYYKIFCPDGIHSQLHMLLSDGSEYTTRPYINTSLQYMELIDYLLFGEARTDYSYLDVYLFPKVKTKGKRGGK